MLPGTYTVKLTKGDQVYTEQLNVAIDPRAKYSLEERKAQFDLSMKVYQELEHMTYGSGSDRRGARRRQRAGEQNCRRKIRCAKQLQQLAADCDALRSKIVATKEGGMITGEERIREHLGQLYGAVTGYDGKPTDYQVARTESLGHELQDVIDDFQKLAQKELPAINAGLKKKKLEPITVLAEGDWQKKKAESSAAAGAGMRAEEGQMRERD